jgi:hypothetical protein
VKQLCADDSAATSVKVGYRQACYKKKPRQKWRGFFASGVSISILILILTRTDLQINTIV